MRKALKKSISNHTDQLYDHFIISRNVSADTGRHL